MSGGREIGVAGPDRNLELEELSDEAGFEIALEDGGRYPFWLGRKQLFGALNKIAKALDEAFRFQIDLDAVVGIGRLAAFDLRIDPGAGTLSFRPIE